MIGGARAKTRYEFECFDKHGNLKWKDGFDNLVVTEGLNHLLDAAIKTGVSSPVWYVGLKDTGSVAAADTLASKAWSELSAIYSESTRPEFVEGTIAAGSVDNSASKASFSITSADDVYGAFLANNSVKGGTTGILYGAGDFTSARSVENGDTLNVTITVSVSAS